MIDPITTYILNELEDWKKDWPEIKLGKWDVQLRRYGHSGKICSEAKSRTIINGVKRNLKNIYRYALDNAYKSYKDYKGKKSIDKQKYAKRVNAYCLEIRSDCSVVVLFDDKISDHSLEVELSRTFKPLRVGFEG